MSEPISKSASPFHLPPIERKKSSERVDTAAVHSAALDRFPTLRKAIETYVDSKQSKIVCSPQAVRPASSAFSCLLDTLKSARGAVRSSFRPSTPLSKPSESATCERNLFIITRLINHHHLVLGQTPSDIQQELPIISSIMTEYERYFQSSLSPRHVSDCYEFLSEFFEFFNIFRPCINRSSLKFTLPQLIYLLSKDEYPIEISKLINFIKLAIHLTGSDCGDEKKIVANIEFCRENFIELNQIIHDENELFYQVIFREVYKLISSSNWTNEVPPHENAEFMDNLARYIHTMFFQEATASRMVVRQFISLFLHLQMPNLFTKAMDLLHYFKKENPPLIDNKVDVVLFIKQNLEKDFLLKAPLLAQRIKKLIYAQEGRFENITTLQSSIEVIQQYLTPRKHYTFKSNEPEYHLLLKAYDIFIEFPECSMSILLLKIDRWLDSSQVHASLKAKPKSEWLNILKSYISIPDLFYSFLEVEKPSELQIAAEILFKKFRDEKPNASHQTIVNLTYEELDKKKSAPKNPASLDTIYTHWWYRLKIDRYSVRDRLIEWYAIECLNLFPELKLDNFAEELRKLTDELKKLFETEFNWMPFDPIEASSCLSRKLRGW